MNKILQYLYYAGLIVLIVCVIYLTTVLYLSPRQDAADRGFIPCTKDLVYELSGCERGALKCPLKILWKDMKCNIGVIHTGFTDWLRGEQKTPWANYLFEPQILTFDEEALYSSDAVQDMSDIEKRNRFILQKHRELEAAKEQMLNLDQDVIRFDPEAEKQNEPAIKVNSAVLSNLPPDDIKDEADITLETKNNRDADGIAAPRKPDILQHLYDKTAEKLQKGNLKNEK